NNRHLGPHAGYEQDGIERGEQRGIARFPRLGSEKPVCGGWKRISGIDRRESNAEYLYLREDLCRSHRGRRHPAMKSAIRPYASPTAAPCERSDGAGAARWPELRR